MTHTPTAVDISHVHVSYGDIPALVDASVTIPQGGIHGLVGMNGSGKSTLFKAIVGLVTPTHGEVRVCGMESRRARTQGIIGYVPQSEDVDWGFPVDVRTVVMMGRYGQQNLLRRARPSDHEAVERALERVELSEFAGRQIGQLSGGQRKRAFVARGIAQGARVLLLDEPFAGVDRKSEATMLRVLRELSEEGTTIIVSTHDLAGLPRLADTAVLLGQRRVLLHDAPAEVLRPHNLAAAFGADLHEVSADSSDKDAA